MDNYYNLFRQDNKVKKHKSSTKHTKHHASYGSYAPHNNKRKTNTLFTLLKVFLYLFLVIVLVFLLLILFSSKLTYQTGNEANIEIYLKELTKYERVSGTENEIETAKYINELMSDYGFESRLDGFEIAPYDGTSYGRNVVAIKDATQDIDNGDVLIITTHYDSVLNSVGANDNASGTAALLELANAIKGEKTDTKIVFVFLSDTYNDYRGARYFLSNMQNLNINVDKVIGVINVEKVGINTKSGFKLITSDLKHTTVSTILDEYAKKITKNDLDLTYETLGVHNVFTENNIPTVTIESRAGSMYEGLSLDTMEKISISNVKKTTDILENTLREIMKQSTISYLDLSKNNNSYQKDVFVMTKDTIVPFGSIKEEVEDMMKLKGIFAGSDINNENEPLDLYSYKMKWFNNEANIDTKYVYKNSILSSVNVMLDDYMELDEALKTIKKYLEVNAVLTQVDGYDIYTFNDTQGRKTYTITAENKNKYSLVVTNYYKEDTIYETGDLYTKTSNNKPNGEEKEEKLLSLISKILMPRDIKRVNKFILFTDGLGYKKGYTTVEDKLNDNSKFTFAIDLDDAFDNDNNYRNYKETIKTIIYNYAYILALNEKQVILTQTPSPDMIYMFDNGVYQDTSYLKLYRDTFFKNTKKIITTQVVMEDNSRKYNENDEENIEDEVVPEALVTKIVTTRVDYTGQEIMDDFAQNFVTFIMENKDSAEKSKNEKVLFFYNYEELVNIREYIRNNLGL